MIWPPEIVRIVDGSYWQPFCSGLQVHVLRFRVIIPPPNEVGGGYTGFTLSVCQFAADDILLYKICYNIQWIYFTIWEKGKEELSPLQYHFKSLHIISRHYKKSLLRSQIYHGYEELSTDTNYPIWRRQKLPYMKKTRKKKQVCGAACFMAAEIKFSEDVRPSVCRRHGFRSISQVCFGISVSNFICMLMVAIGRSLLIFSDVTFKMAAWRPYWIFWFPESNFTLALNINFKLQRQNLCIWVGAYWFSATSFPKLPPGGHIRFFGFWTL